MNMKSLLGFNPAYGKELRLYHGYVLAVAVLMLGAHVWLFGWRLLLLSACGSFSGLAVEVLFSRCRHKPVTGGALLTGVLLGLLVPADLPCWMMVLACVVGTLFAQEAFGGAETCIFHPALIAKAFLLISYPAHFVKFTYQEAFDAVPQGYWLVLGILLLGMVLNLIFRPRTLLAYVGMAAGAYVVLRFAVGMTHLTEVANLKDCGVGDLFDLRYAFLNDHVLLIGILFAVAPCGLPRSWGGTLCLGFLLGVFGLLIRCFGRYPDSMVFAVLICDAIAPTLDWLFRGKSPLQPGEQEPVQPEGGR